MNSWPEIQGDSCSGRFEPAGTAFLLVGLTSWPMIMDYDYGKSSFKVQGLVCLIFNRCKIPAVKFIRNNFFLIFSCIFIPSHVFVLVLNFQILLAFQTTHKECICFFSGASSLRSQSPKLMSRLHCPIRKEESLPIFASQLSVKQNFQTFCETNFQETRTWKIYQSVFVDDDDDNYFWLQPKAPLTFEFILKTWRVLSIHSDPYQALKTFTEK